MNNMGNLSREEYKIVADLRLKSVTKFIDDLGRNNDVLDLILSKEIPGGVRCYFNMEAAFSALFIFYIEMLKNGVPNNILEKVFLDNANNIVKKGGEVMERELQDGS